MYAAILTLAMLGQANREPSTPEALAYAASVVSAMPEHERVYQRFVWVPPWADAKWVYGTSYAINLAVSRSDNIYLPDYEGKAGQGWVMRLDLRRLAPKGTDVAGLIQRWEKLANAEPYFTIRVEKDGKKVAAPAPHTGLTNATLLRGATLSNVPIVRADWLCRIALTNKDGGLYYDFAGIEKSQDPKLTDQQWWFAKFGFDENASKKQNRIRSAVMLKSGVTGRQRRVDYFSGQSVDGGIWITRDQSIDGARQIKSSPVANLVKFEDQAREAFAFKSNGLQEFALFNNAGALVAEVPPDIAVDHDIPRPYSTILEPGVSCIRCHGKSDGFLPAANDLRKIVDAGVDVLGDLSQANQDETVDQLARRYLTRDVDKFLTRSREDYTEAVMKSTYGELDPKEAAEVIAEIFQKYQYTDIDAAAACRELGYRVEKDATKAFSALVPRLPNHEPYVPTFEHDIVGPLKAGIGVVRSDWERTYADAAFRTMKSQRQSQDGQNQPIEIKTEVEE